MTNRWANPINNNILRDLEGTVLASGSVAFYAAGTSTPLAVYSDPELTVSLGSFINADAFGLLPDFHLASGTQYKMVAYDAVGGAGGAGAVKWTRDDVFGLDSSVDTRLDAIESLVDNLDAGKNAILNGGCSVLNLDADGDVVAAPSVSATAVESQSKDVLAQSNYIGGTAAVGYSTDVPSGAYMTVTGYTSIFADSYVRAIFQSNSSESSRFVNKEVTARVKVWHNCGAAKNAVMTVLIKNSRDGVATTATAVLAGSAVSIPDQTWTDVELTVPDMGNCSNGIVVRVDITGGAVTSKNFRFSSAQLDEGGTLPAFTETDPGIAKGALNALTFTERYTDNEIAQFAQRAAGQPWLNGVGGVTAYTTGSGNWTVPDGVYRVKYTLTGGGGGGGGRDPGVTGSSGSNSTFNTTIVAGGGVGGAGGSAAGPQGGTATGGDLNIPGGGGESGDGGAVGKQGGASYWGGGGAGTGSAADGLPGLAYGSGGGGAQGASVAACSGSGAGTCIGILTVSPGDLIPYAIGAGGAGGSSTRDGGAGAGGVLVLEY